MAELEPDLLESTDQERRILVNGGHTGGADANVAATLENSLAPACDTATLLSSGKECVIARLGSRQDVSRPCEKDRFRDYCISHNIK